MKSLFITFLLIATYAAPSYSQKYFFVNYERGQTNLAFYYGLLFGDVLVGNNNKQMIIDSHIKKISKTYVKYNIDKQTEKTTFKNYIQFDNIGNILEYVYYNGKEKLRNKEQYQYDSNNKLIEYKTFSHKNIMKYNRIYKYNDYGNITEYISYNKKNEIRTKLVFLFDSAHNITEQINYKRDGIELRSKFVYKYNSEGKRTETVWYNADGKIKRKWVYDCSPSGELVKNLKDTMRVCKNTETDSLGNKIIVELVTSGKNKVRKTVSKYDSRDNILEFLVSNPKGKIITREKFNYNSNNNLLEYTEYRRKGIDVRYKYSYNFNEKNQCISSLFYYGRKNNKIDKSQYNYNDNGNLLEIKSIDDKNKKHYFLTKYSYEYL